jgi:hypothetical protein
LYVVVVVAGVIACLVHMVMSGTQVGAGCNVVDRCSADSDTKAYLLRGFEKWGQQHHLNSMDKLRAVASVVKGEPELALWVLKHLELLRQTSRIGSSLSLRELSRNPKSNTPGNQTHAASCRAHG